MDDAHGPSAHPALPRPGILPAILLFKRVVKDVLALNGGPIAQCFFKPSKNGYHRLEPWQITNHMPCVSFNAWASDEEQVQIAKGILSFRCAITRKNASAIQEGTLHLAPAPLRVRGRLEWHKLLTPTTQLVATLVNIRKEAAQARTHNQTKLHVPNTLQLTCTQCSTARTASYHSLLAPRDGSRFGAEANAVGRGPPKNGNAHVGCYGTSAPCMPMVASAPLPDQLPPGAHHGHACSNPCHAPCKCMF